MKKFIANQINKVISAKVSRNDVEPFKVFVGSQPVPQELKN